MYSDLIGKPFAYHGRGPDSYDCLGLVMEVFKRNDIPIGALTSLEDPAAIASKLDNYADHLQELPGPRKLSVVMFSIVYPYVSHMGVMLDDYGRFIHAIQDCSVSIENINSPLWKRKVKGFYKWTA